MKVLQTAAIFNDNMVLQRNKPISFWGVAEQGNKVTIRIADKTSDTYSDINGNWKISFPPMQAGGPYEIEITDGTNKLVFKNVMIGEVWFAGGQSNMQFELCRCRSFAETSKRLGSGKSDIRCYITAKQSYFSDDYISKEKSVKWLSETDDGFGTVSAVAYYAAEQISKNLPGITIGIVCCYWGGTSASNWIDKDTLCGNELLCEYIKDYQKATEGQTIEDYKEKFNEFLEYNRVWYDKYNKLLQEKPGTTWDEAVNILGPDRWCPPLGPYSQCAPAVLFNTMFMRVCPYTVKGIWFYQGESDDHKPYIYSELLEALIEKWRKCWDDLSLPFMFIQLPMFCEDGYEDNRSWAIIREAQQKVFNRVKNTGMVIAVDQGEYNNIHPYEKKYIGERLGKQSLMYTYNIGTESDIFGPVFSECQIRNNTAEILFENAEDGLFIHGSTVNGFELAEHNGNFKAADAQITGSKIILTSDEVAAPVYVRYLFCNYSEVNLFGKNGIPVSPFRADNF